MKIASALPKGTLNGLTAIDRALVNQPEQSHLIIAEVDCKSVTTDTDTGDTEPTIRILHVEVVPREHADLVEQIKTRTFGRRTGDNPLPFDLATVSGLIAHGGTVNVDTGEVTVNDDDPTDDDGDDPTD